MKPGEKTDCTRLKIERHGSVPKPVALHSPRLRGATCLGVEEAAAVGHGAVAEPEPVEGREAVEPMAEPGVAGLELGRGHAHERSRQPGGTAPVTGSRSTAISSSWLWNPSW